MSLSNKQFLLSSIQRNTTTKSLSNKLVSLPPETYSSTSTSPTYGISFDASTGKPKLITLINENYSKIGAVSSNKQSKVSSIGKQFGPVESHDGYRTDIRTTKHYIEDEDTSVYCLSDVSSLDLNCKEDNDEDTD